MMRIFSSVFSPSRSGKKTIIPVRSRVLKMEHLEERALLDAGGIDFASPQTYEHESTEIPNANYFKTYIHDFNGDGIQDVIALGKDVITFFSGRDLSKANHLDITTPFGISDAVLGDFNGDGILDLALVSGTTGASITMYAGTVNYDTMQPEFLRVATISGDFISPNNLGTGEFFGNRTQNTNEELFFIARDQDNNLRAHVYQFDRHFVETVSASTVISGVPASDTFTVAIGNLGGNALDDFVIIGRNESLVRVFYNNGTNAEFTQSENIQIGETGKSKITALALADLDGNGSLEIVAINGGQKKDGSGSGEMVIMYKKDGLYQAGEENYFDIGGNPSSLHLADLDGDEFESPDILVGLNNDTKFVVFQNFSQTGEGISKTAEPIDTGFYTASEQINIGLAVGRIDANASNDIVIVSGNKVRIIKNNTVFTSQNAEIKITYRVLENNSAIPAADHPNPENYQPNCNVDWVDEWSSFYIDIWAASLDSGGILSFDNCVLNFDPNIFRIESVEKGPSFSDVRMNEARSENGIITLSGTADGSGGKDGAYTLLARVLVRPAIGKSGSSGDIGINIENDGYASSIGNVFAFGGNTWLETEETVDKGGIAKLNPLPNLDVYPVIYDVNDSGNVNFSDLLSFLSCYGRKVADSPENLKYDFNHEGEKINFQDLLVFLSAYGTSRTKAQNSTKTRYVNYASNFPDEWIVADFTSLSTDSSRSYAIIENVKTEFQMIGTNDISTDINLHPSNMTEASKYEVFFLGAEANIFRNDIKSETKTAEISTCYNNSGSEKEHFPASTISSITKTGSELHEFHDFVLSLMFDEDEECDISLLETDISAQGAGGLLKHTGDLAILSEN